jgi:ABC-2 family transporter protein
MGYSMMHNWITNHVLRVQTKNPQANIAVTIVPFKYDERNSDDFQYFLQTLLPFFMLLVFILPVYRLISNMVSEKETKARESMKIMGLKDLSYWASWFVFHFIRVTIISALSTLILSFNVVVKSNPFIVFLFFWIFGNSLFAFSLFIQSFFSRERIAALCGTLIYFGSSFLNIVVGDEKIPERFKYAGSLISTVAVIRGSETLAYFEIKDEGLHFSNIDRLLRFFSF